MDAFLLYSGLVIVTTVGLQQWARRSRKPVPAEFGVDPALTTAIDQGFIDHCQRATY